MAFPKVRAPVVGAVAVIVISAAIALEATTFDVLFPTDPLGPKAFPLFAALLLAFGGVALLRDGVAGGPAGPAPAAGAAKRIALGTLSFVAYAFLLAPLGFVLATVLEFALLAWLFGGTLVRGASAGLVFAGVLYVLFVYGLGLPLPLGLFEA